MQSAALILLGVIFTLAAQGAIKNWNQMACYKDIRKKIGADGVEAYMEWLKKRERGGEQNGSGE